VQLYRAENAELTEWRHRGAVFQALERETFNVECPNLFKLGTKWVLIVSPHRPCEYYVGELDLDSCAFVPETHGIIDAGDAYASSISVDDRGRSILWLWGRTRTPPGRGWNGVMVLPRVLSIGPDGALRQQVPTEFARLRGAVTTRSNIRLARSSHVLEGIPADAVEIEAVFAVRGFAAFGFELRRSASEAPSATIAIRRGHLSVGSARAYIGQADRYTVRLFLDKRCLEVYVNDGTAALYSALDAVPAERLLSLFARTPRFDFGDAPGGDAEVIVESLRAWPLSPATFSLERFEV
jgi:beta-fructofuranosidase